jgi:hypothetical protein
MKNILFFVLLIAGVALVILQTTSNIAASREMQLLITHNIELTETLERCQKTYLTCSGDLGISEETNLRLIEKNQELMEQNKFLKGLVYQVIPNAKKKAKEP